MKMKLKDKKLTDKEKIFILKITNEGLIDRIVELRRENEQLKQQIEKLKIKKSCSNCKHYDEPFCRQENEIGYFKCENHSEWELAE